MSQTIDVTRDIRESVQPTVMNLIEQASRRYPGYPAIKQGGQQRSYSELISSIEELAHQLIHEEIAPGDVIAIHGGKSLATITAMLSVLWIGGVMLPLDEDLPLARKAILLREGAAKSVLLTGGHEIRLCEDIRHFAIDSRSCRLKGSKPALANSVYTSFPSIDPASPAYIFFTSGTTGRPKGILGSHKGLSHFVRWEQEEFAIGPDDRIAQLTSLSFDAILKDIFPPLISGGTLALPMERPFDNPHLLLGWLDTEKITIIQTVPSVVSSWLLAASHERYSLQSVRLLALAGEPLLGTLVLEWKKKFPACSAEIINLYGPTETTILKSYYRLPPDVSPGVQPIGYPLPDTQLLILDRNDRLCGIGELGEIVIRTKFGTLGYINASAEDRRQFFVNPFRNDPRDVLYRTGDSGRFEPNGIVTIAGRLDDQVKIRGVRIQPAEVASVLANHPDVGSCVVLPWQNDQQELALAAYVVPRERRQLTGSELRDYLAAYLPPSMLPTSYRFLEKMPLMANGKVDRKSLPSPRSAMAPITSAEQPTAVQELVMHIWEEVLKIEQVELHDNFFDLGGHSLLIFQVVSRIRKVFGIEVDIATIFESPTVAQLSRRIEETRARVQGLRIPPITPVSKDGPFPLSFSQRRLWFLHQLEPRSSSYNMTGTLCLKGRMNMQLLERCIHELADRHASLRTSFSVNDDDQPIAIVAPSLSLSVTFIDVSQLSDDERFGTATSLIKDHAQQPFDLAAGPLLRVALLKLNEEEHLLTLTMHHIISDGWSWGILIQEFATLWEAYSNQQSSPLPQLSIQYGDFALWQQQWLTGDVMELQLAYWRDYLAGPLPLLELPTDYPRPSVQTYRGAHQELSLPPALSKDLYLLARKQGVTLFMVLLSAFTLLLSRHSGQEDIIVGSDSAGRGRTELEAVVGFFVNTLTLRTDLSGDLSFTDLIVRVRNTLLGAYTYQDAPFEKLVEILHPERDLSRSPLFQVMFRMSPLASPVWHLSSIEISLLQTEGQTAKFDLTVIVSLINNVIALDFEYNIDLFSTERVAVLQKQFVYLLRQIVQKPQAHLSSYSLVIEAEMRSAQALSDRLTEPEMPPVMDMVRHIASTYPLYPALRQGDHEWTYYELMKATDTLIQQFLSQGMVPGQVVGIHGGKHLGTMVALLAVLSIGCVALPLDEHLPPKRKHAMLTQSAASYLVYSGTGEVQPGLAIRSLFVDAHTGLSKEIPLDQFMPEYPFYPAVASNDPAYIFFTSGTTGMPKGIIGTHKGIAHFLRWEKDEFKVKPGDRVAQLTTLSFDAVLRDIFLPLTSGATLCLPLEREASEPAELLAWLESEAISIVHTVPSMLANWLTTDTEDSITLKTLRVLCLSGEPLRGSLVHHWQRKFPACKAEIVNFYGPTETTMIKSYYGLPETPLPWVQPIGQPLPNAQLLIMREGDRLCGVGELGEIVIRTPFRTLGYINESQEGASGFYPNPFSNDPEDLFYRTGDLGRREPDGTIRIAGRVDDQVKIRGVRVQPSEVVSVLSTHPQVKSCTVLPLQRPEEEQALVAYVVANDRGPIHTDEMRDYLLSYLPSAMVPSHFHFLKELPLLPNGKIDRKALLTLDLSGVQNPYVSPQTPLQSKLSEIWRQVLKLEQINIHDDFFEVGGHSLLATLVVTRMRKAFGVELTLRNLLEHPTIARLAKIIEGALQGHHAAAFSPLVGMQTRGEHPPIFCIHPIGGGVLCYRNLATALGEDQPLYAMQAFGLEEMTEPVFDIRSMADMYIREMRRIQSRGPFALCGWSLGGLIAFEMAQQLQRAGEEISLLGLLDSYSPLPGSYCPIEDDDQLFLMLAKDLLAVAQITVDEQYLSSKKSEERSTLLYRQLKEQGALDDTADLQRYLAVFKANQLAASHYSAIKSDLRITLFLALDQQRESNISPSLGWKELAVGVVDVIGVPGDHYSILWYPDVVKLAGEIQRQLNNNCDQ